MRTVQFPLLMEPVPIADDFVQGIARIERVGPCARIILYSDQTLVEAGVHARVVIRKIIMPIEVLPVVISQANEFMAVRAFANVFKLRS